MSHSTDQHWHGWDPTCRRRTTAPHTGDTNPRWEPRCTVCETMLEFAELHPAHWSASDTDDGWRTRIGEMNW